MPKPRSLGRRIGGRKIDCQNYTPKSGNFSDHTIIRHEWPDGWKIVEDVTLYDIQLMSHLTLTCVSGDEIIGARYVEPDKKLVEQELVLRAKVITQRMYDTPYYRKCYKQWGAKTFEEYLEVQFQETLKNFRQRKAGRSSVYGKKDPFYRFMHVEDDQGRLHACILLGEAELADEQLSGKSYRYSYGNHRDLGQKHPISIDGADFHVLECRLGTGTTAPKVALERVVDWYANATGKWSNKDFQAVQAQRYTAIKELAPPEEERPA